VVRRLPAAVPAAALLAALTVLLLAAPGAGAQPPGSLDPSFNGSGLVRLAAGSQLFALAVQPDGQVVAAGQSGGRVLVVRYTTSGSLDGQYVGGAGVARAVAIQPDGKIVVAGASGGAMVVERLTPALTPDAGFGAGGVAGAFGGQSAVANAVAVGPDGSIAIAGAVNPPDTRVGVARFAPDGRLDWSEVPGFDHYSEIDAIAIQPADGKIVFVGHQTPLQTTDALIGRLNPGGALDPTFNGHGVFTYHYPGGGYTALQTVALQSDGRIVAAGIDVGGPHAIVLRLNADGSFDQSFGSGGVAALPSGQNTTTGDPIGAYAVGIAGGGRIIAAGNYQNTGTVVDATTWAFTAAGAPEPAFGTGGVNRNPTGGYELCGLAIAPDGSLLAAGNTVTALNDVSPCSANGSAAGFIARYVGYGPPPAPQAGAAPAAITGPPAEVRETSATVTGEVNPDGLATTWHFDYGPSSSYGASTTAATLPAAEAQTPLSATLVGLAPGTTYHYRLVAVNADGAGYGADRTFTTAPARRPSARTGATTGAGEVAATVHGEVDPGGLPTTYRFQFGRSAAYSSSTPARIVSGVGAVSVSARLRGLSPGTRYHYRLVAVNADGAGYGADRTFTTAPRLTLRLLGLLATYRTAAIERRGLTLAVACNQGCAITGALVISRATARALGLGGTQLVIGKGVAALRRRGRARLTLRLTAAARRALAGAGRLQATVRLRGRPAGGGPAALASKQITLER
jgi:uncharacterized delta-60 repeat protein